MEKKPKYITKENYRQFKPSEFIRSFASDVDVAIRKKMPMDMAAYTHPARGCLPCLGGLACMNLGMEQDENIFNDPVFEQVSSLGNDIRLGNLGGIKSAIAILYDDSIKSEITLPQPSDIYWGGIVRDKKELREIQKEIHKFADAYEAAGY